MPDLPPLTSRRDQQRLTRERLVFAARAAFARDGYHGANLEAIAREAGFSKGAVYSNFAGKAELFLAVMDVNIAAVVDEEPGDAAPTGGARPAADDARRFADHPEFEEALRGFALATLEFIATAARDDRLRAECGKRVALLIEGYAELAEESGEDSGLTRTERGALLAALDQGSAILALSGADVLSEEALAEGLLRLAGSEHGAAATMTARRDEAVGRQAFHYAEVRRRISVGLGAEIERRESEDGGDD